MTQAIIRTYRFPLKTNRKQRDLLDKAVELCREIHNAAIQERREAWKLCRKSIGYFDQSAQIKEIRKERQDVAQLPFVIARESLHRIDKAFQSFFQRAKRGEKPGYPRFRSRDRYDSITLTQDFRVEGNQIKLPKWGWFRFKPHREIIGTPKQVTLKRLGLKKWMISIVCDLGAAPKKVELKTSIGIDVGVKVFASLSNGEQIPNPRWLKQSEDEIAKRNRQLATKKRGSNNRAKAKERIRRAYAKVANRRLNFCHHISKNLVSRFDLIAFEKLKIQSMMKKHFSKSIMDAAWGQFAFCLTYKAAEAGKWAVSVDPIGTSQRCSQCGADVPKDLSVRVHSCAHCGYVADRDLNASLNILALGRSAVGFTTAEVRCN